MGPISVFPNHAAQRAIGRIAFSIIQQRWNLIPQMIITQATLVRANSKGKRSSRMEPLYFLTLFQRASAA